MQSESRVIVVGWEFERSSSRKIVLIRKELERARWKVNREVQGMSGVQ